MAVTVKHSLLQTQVTGGIRVTKAFIRVGEYF